MPMTVKVGRVMSYEEPVKSHDSLIGLDKLCNPAKIVGNVLNITIVHLPRRVSRYLPNTPSRCLQSAYALKTSWKTKNVTLKTSSACLQRVFTKTNVNWEENRSIFTITLPMAIRLGKMVTQDERLPPIKLLDHMIT